MNYKRAFSIALLSLITTAPVFAKQIDVKMYLINQPKSEQYIGKVTLKDTSNGLLIEPHLTNLSPGIHGFHVHQNPNCGNHGKAAGGHYDSKRTGKHLGPYNSNGHIGDLPALSVDKQGRAELPTLAPRLSINKIMGRALMIHANGDNYSDIPKKLGGGGARVACGVVQNNK